MLPSYTLVPTMSSDICCKYFRKYILTACGLRLVGLDGEKIAGCRLRPVEVQGLTCTIHSPPQYVIFAVFKHQSAYFSWLLKYDNFKYYFLRLLHWREFYQKIQIFLLLMFLDFCKHELINLSIYLGRFPQFGDSRQHKPPRLGETAEVYR